METSQTEAELAENARKLKSLPEFQPLRFKQRLFLIAYIASGSVETAARTVGITSMGHYQWMWRETDYPKAYEKAQEIYADYCEGDVNHRAFHATKKSDILAMFALKKMRPAYRDNPQLAVNVNNAPPAITFNVLQQLPSSTTTISSEASGDPLSAIKQIVDKSSS